MLTLRQATAEDASTLLDFIRALAEYERQPQAVEVTAATLRQQLSAAEPPFECLLAEAHGVPVGFALFFRTYSTWRGRPGIWLEDLFVLPEARKRGIGRALLARLARIAAERGYARFEWSVLDWNEPAIGFYRRLGAEVLGDWRICRISDEALIRLARS
jgi:GNAT superfamily N-acetyltransferase